MVQIGRVMNILGRETDQSGRSCSLSDTGRTTRGQGFVTHGNHASEQNGASHRSDLKDSHVIVM